MSRIIKAKNPHRIRRGRAVLLAFLLAVTALASRASAALPVEAAQAQESEASGGGEAAAGEGAPDDLDARYKTAPVEYADLREESSASASVLWLKEEALTFPHENAFVEEVLVQRNDWVQEGDVLIRFRRLIPQAEPAKLELGRKQMIARHQAELESIESRGKDLETQKADASAKNDAAAVRQFGREQRRLEIEKGRTLRRQDRESAELEAQIRFYQDETAAVELTAPFTGIVTEITRVKAGDLISPYDVLAILQDPFEAYLTFEDRNNAFRYGQDIVIEYGTAKDPRKIDGRIVSAGGLSQIADEAQQSDVWVSVSREDLAASARELGQEPAEFTLQELINKKVTAPNLLIEHVLTVPKRAVNIQNMKSYVYILEDGVVRRRYFEPGESDRERVQVLSGLEAGQICIVR